MSCEADNFTESSDDHDDFIKCDQLELTERAVYILVMFLFSVAAVPIVSLDMANSTFIQVNQFVHKWTRKVTTQVRKPLFWTFICNFPARSVI